MTTSDDAHQLAKLELFKNELQHHEALSATLVSLAQAALRVSFLLNGGAVIAALSVYSAKGNGSALPVWAFGAATLCWVAGLIASAVAVGKSTLAQREFQARAGYTFRKRGREFFDLPIPPGEDSKEPNIKQGYNYRDQSIFAWQFSIGAFIAGSVLAIVGLIFDPVQVPIGMPSP